MNSKAAASIFAEQYCLLRRKENRFYSDEELLLLPKLSKKHPHYKEWLTRRNSCRRLIKYLRSKQQPLHILEVGCGNGWLSAQLAGIKNATVTGIDINTEELEQARRVFADKNNLSFARGELGKDILPGQHYDVIVFAASMQYFPSVKRTVSAALSHLTLMGEVHIMDTVLYKKEEVFKAGLRSRAYFSGLSFPQMAEYYFHHCIDTIQQFDHRVLYNPLSFFNRIKPGRNPFYHILITGKK